MKIFLLLSIFTLSSLAGDLTQMVCQNILEKRLSDFCSSFSDACKRLEKNCSEEHNNLCLLLDDISLEDGIEISTDDLEEFVAKGFNEKKLLPLLKNISIHIHESDYEDFLNEYKSPFQHFSLIAVAVAGATAFILIYPWLFYAINKSNPPNNLTIYDENHIFLTINISISGLVFLGFLASLTTFIYHQCCLKDFKKAISSPDLENNDPSLRKLDTQKNILIAIRAFKKQVKNYITNSEMENIDNISLKSITNKYLSQVKESYDGLVNAQLMVKENLRKYKK